MSAAVTRTAWSQWSPHASGSEYTVGIEEEVMLLHPHNWSLAQQIDRVLPTLPPELTDHVTSETHRSALELATGVHPRVGEAQRELEGLRDALETSLTVLGLRAAGAGTHPFAVWQDTVVSPDSRYQAVYGSMRELARREPTFAVHVHVGIRDAENAIVVAGRRGAAGPSGEVLLVARLAACRPGNAGSGQGARPERRERDACGQPPTMTPARTVPCRCHVPAPYPLEVEAYPGCG